jgi:hypothetical protein
MIDTNHVQAVMVRLKNHGFELRFTSGLGNASVRDQECHAFGAAAALLFDVPRSAFDDGSKWSVAGRHVRSRGLLSINGAQGSDLGLDDMEIQAVNAALSLAVKICAFATARSS